MRNFALVSLLLFTSVAFADPDERLDNVYVVAEDMDEWYDENTPNPIHEHQVLCGAALMQLGGSTTSSSYLRKVLRTYEDRMDTCLNIASLAKEWMVEETFAISIAWVESKFSEKVVSSAGAVGPMQVLPKYWCPNGKQKGCDLTIAGIRALDRLVSKYDTLAAAACHYNSGLKCNKHSRRYATRVLVIKQRLDTLREWLRG